MNESVNDAKTDILQVWKAENDAPGKYLKQMRELEKKSIKEMASELGVAIEQVQALEDNDKGKLPAPIYVKSYIKRYCLSLGVSENEVLALIQGMEKHTTPVLGRVSLQKNTNFRHAVMRGLGYLFIALVILALLYGARSLDLGGLWTSVSSSLPSEESTATELSLPIVSDENVN